MEWCVGIDLTKDYIQISAMEERMREPETFAQDKNSKKYQIPTALAQKSTTGEWLYGEEALALIDNDQYIVIDDIYGMALRKEKVKMRGEVIGCNVLFGLLLQRCINLIFTRHKNVELGRVVFTVRYITDEVIALIDEVSERLHIPRELVSLQDYKESFYYYALSAFPQLCNYEVVLYDYNEDGLSSLRLSMNHHTSPKIVSIKEEAYPGFGRGFFGGLRKKESLDAEFHELVTAEFEGKVIGCVFLVGDGFDGDWMKESLETLCHNRRAFLGKNLYTKGAVYSMYAGKSRPWDYVYLGEEKLKANLYLPLKMKGKETKVDLISAGENWYEARGDLYVILEEGNEISILLKKPDGYEVKEEKLILDGLPKRPPKTSRLHITAKPLQKDLVFITVTDEGFGSLYESSGKRWEFRLTI